MRAELVRFGVIRIDGKLYDHDVIISSGMIRKRAKKASKPYKAQYGHTPLSANEAIPWGTKNLVVGTGVYGCLPIMDEVYSEAKKRNVEIIPLLTEEACELLFNMASDEICAILHVTC